MRQFNHINAASLAEAAEALKTADNVAIAGGGDLIGALKDDIFPEYPKTVVNLKSIPGLSYIKLEDGVIKIGALTTLADIARSDIINEHMKALAEAAGKASAPALRETTTIGGNICQLPRCWYFRKLGNRFYCARKGGDRCFALSGDNRYHSVFGGAAFEPREGTKRVCVAVNQADSVPVLIAAGAKFITTERTIDAADFFAVGTLSTTVLNKGEILTGIEIPVSVTAKNCTYKRFTFRKSIDFPILGIAISSDAEKNYSIVVGGAAPVPYEAAGAEALLKGKDITPELAEEAGVKAVDGARPYEANAYKVHLIKTLIKRELIARIPS